MVIPALALGTTLDLIGAVKVYLDQIAEFDDVVEETKEVLALLEPAVLEALNTNSTGEGGALHTHFTSLDEKLKGFHATIMAISKRPCFIRFFRHSHFSSELKFSLNKLRNSVTLLNVGIASTVKKVETVVNTMETRQATMAATTATIG